MPKLIFQQKKLYNNGFVFILFLGNKRRQSNNSNVVRSCGLKCLWCKLTDGNDITELNLVSNNLSSCYCFSRLSTVSFYAKAYITAKKGIVIVGFFASKEDRAAIEMF
jgi:hypothetical protein